MLPVYEAIDIKSILSKKVGHTEPWVVLVNTPLGLKSFVTKLYTTAEVENNNSVTNEIICNTLASQFDLKAPGCAFIDIPEELVLSKPQQYQFQYSSVDPRLKFGTEMLEGVTAAIPQLSKSYYKQRLSLDTLYAFDNMIRNADRGQQKTNLLMGSKSAFLIDHEYTLNINHITDIDWNDFSIENKFTHHHLLYTYLKRSKKNNKQYFFDEFQEYIKTMNINQLNSYFKQLSNEGFTTQQKYINNWLTELKQNSTTFVNSLKASLI